LPRLAPHWRASPAPPSTVAQAQILRPAFDHARSPAPPIRAPLLLRATLYLRFPARKVVGQPHCKETTSSKRSYSGAGLILCSNSILVILSLVERRNRLALFLCLACLLGPIFFAYVIFARSSSGTGNPVQGFRSNR
jgi:hypothetical protein